MEPRYYIAGFTMADGRYLETAPMPVKEMEKFAEMMSSTSFQDRALFVWDGNSKTIVNSRYVQLISFRLDAKEK